MVRLRKKDKKNILVVVEYCKTGRLFQDKSLTYNSREPVLQAYGQERSYALSGQDTTFINVKFSGRKFIRLVKRGRMNMT